MSRFSAHPAPDGLLVLDTWTGEVVLVPFQGDPVVRRAAVSTATLVGAPAPTAILAEPGPTSLNALLETAPTHERDLAREVVGGWPTPIARAYRRYLSEPEPRHRSRALVDTFTCVLKLWALQIASEYLRAESVSDPALQELLERDISRPLISSWNLVVQRGLAAFRGAGTPLFAPELATAYDALELKCRQRVVVTARYEDADGSWKERRSELGRVQALIRYRNSLAHGFDQSPSKARADLEKYGPILNDVLERSRFLARRPLVHLEPSREGVARGVRLMGIAPGAPVPFEDLPMPRSPGVFFLDEARRELLPLHSYADVTRQEDELDVLLFEGRTRSTFVYVGADGEHVEKAARDDVVSEILAGKRVDRTMPVRDITLDALFEIASRVTARVLESLAASGRYLPQATVPRPEVEKRLEQLVQGDFRGFVLAGEGGVGKTAVLARFAAERTAQHDCVVLLAAASIADADAPGSVLRALGVRGAVYLEDLFAAIDAQLRESGRRLFVIVDALDEHPTDTAALVRGIDALVAKAADYAQVRIVTSIRTAAYERLPSDARFGLAAGTSYFLVDEVHGTTSERTALVPLRRFTDDEVEHAYRLYRGAQVRDPRDVERPPVTLYRPRTESLPRSGSTWELVHDPLMMRLVLAAHRGRVLPPNLAWDEAVKLFLDHVVVGATPEGPGHPERRAFLRSLVEVMDRASSESVVRDDLYKHEPLKRALLNPQKDSPYVQLLDLGVLTEDWDASTCRVRVSHAGLFAFLLAERHEGEISSGAAVRALAARTRSLRSLREALVMILRRGADRGEHDVLVEALASADEADLTTMEEIVRDVVVDLARLRVRALSEVTAALATLPPALIAAPFSGAIDRLFLGGDTERAEELVALLRGLDLDPRQRVAIEVRHGRILHRKGNASDAESCFARAAELATDAGEPLDRARIDVLRAILAVERHDVDAAELLARGAQPTLLEAGARGELSELFRVRALAASTRGDAFEERALLARSIAEADGVGDRSALAKAHNNLAASYLREGAYPEATTHLERALALHQAAGARTSAIVAELNFASQLYREHGEIERARAAYEHVLEAADAARFARGVAAAITSLGALDIVEDDPDRAVERLERALPIWQAARDATNHAYALFLRASAALDRGEDATRWIDEHARATAAEAHGDSALHRAVLAVRAAVRASPDALPETTGLEASISARSGPCAIEDGVSAAWAEAAELAARIGTRDRARTWASAALTFAATKDFPQRARAQAIVES